MHLEAENVRALYKSLLTAWNQREARTFAGLFAEHAEIVGFDGSQMQGPKVVEEHLSGIFASHLTATYVSIVREVRDLGPEVALLTALVGMVPREGFDINPALNAVQTMVARKHEGQWKIELFQNTPTALHGRPEVILAQSEELRQAFRAR